MASSGFEPATALDGTVGASSGILGNLPFLKPGRGRLMLPAPSASAEPGRISGCWRPSTPSPTERILVVPPAGICRVDVPPAASAAAPTDATGTRLMIKATTAKADRTLWVRM